jgi:signal transduction histidine kinase
MSREIRTISYLLHPPLLEIAALLSAMRWYVDGFSERSKIKVDLEIRSEPRRLSNEIELAIFRVVPECLTHIHRHSGGTGVGFRGMRERLRQFNGDLDIQSGASGTCVTASIPLPESKT